MQNKKRKNKSAVSPLVSTVLLIMIVIVLALIIIMWSGVLLKEAITKEIAGEKKTAEQRCSEILIEPFVNYDGSFGFKNIGNVPIYSINLKLAESGAGTSEIIKINQDNGGLVNPGFSTTFAGYNYNIYEKVQIIPIILGKAKSGATQQFTCPDSSGIII